MDRFDQQKAGLQLRTDRSKKGGIDLKIAPLIRNLNALPDYFTTSSCSGRVLLLTRNPARKNETHWLYVTHGRPSVSALKKVIAKESKGVVWFKMESFIVHVCCRSLRHADALLLWCARGGVKRAGIMALHGKIVVEIIGNESIEAVVKKDNEWAVDHKGLVILAAEATKKMERKDEFLHRLQRSIGTLKV